MSIVPLTFPLVVVKSAPTFNCSVVSQVKSGFATFCKAIGTFVPPSGFPYKFGETP